MADISDNEVIARVDSMLERVQAVVAATGGHTRYWFIFLLSLFVFIFS
jgi:hypothetical protein